MHNRNTPKQIPTSTLKNVTGGAVATWPAKKATEWAWNAGSSTGSSWWK